MRARAASAYMPSLARKVPKPAVRLLTSIASNPYGSKHKTKIMQLARYGLRPVASRFMGVEKSHVFLGRGYVVKLGLGIQQEASKARVLPRSMVAGTALLRKNILVQERGSPLRELFGGSHRVPSSIKTQWRSLIMKAQKHNVGDLWSANVGLFGKGKRQRLKALDFTGYFAGIPSGGPWTGGHRKPHRPGSYSSRQGYSSYKRNKQYGASITPFWSASASRQTPRGRTTQLSFFGARIGRQVKRVRVGRQMKQARIGRGGGRVRGMGKGGKLVGRGGPVRVKAHVVHRGGKLARVKSFTRKKGRRR